MDPRILLESDLGSSHTVLFHYIYIYIYICRDVSIYLYMSLYLYIYIYIYLCIYVPPARRSCDKSPDEGLQRDAPHRKALNPKPCKP